jgi:Tfp pilus assembly protein PilV
VVSRKNKQKGIALVEVIVALGVSVAVIVSLVSLSIFTLRNSVQSKLLLQGTKLANRQLELVRAYRDTSSDWGAFVSDISACDNTSMGCCIVLGTGNVYTVYGDPSSCTEGSGLEEITVKFYATKIDGTALDPGDTTVRITVLSNWKIGPEDKQTAVYTDLTNWRAR